ncbi:hypothetical protein KY342_00140, partial [Candidatus Woesearchaeota archaeon]|nr:hypothetical protein [Candidatus Woesearchaeota archaeon]
SFVKDTAKAKQGSKDFIKNIGDKLQKEQKLLAKESVELLSSISPKVSPDVKVTTKILKPTVKDTKKISGNVVSLLQTKETVEKTDLAPKKLFIETMNNKLASVKQIPIQKAISDVGIETIQKKDISRITGKRIKSDTAQKEKVQVISDIISDLGQKQKSKQKIKQRQESRYLFNLEQLKPIKSTPKEQKAKEVPKSKSPIVKIKLDSLPKRLVKSSENGFEAFGFEFGEKKKVKTGTKEEVAIVLKKFLKGGLSASGEVIEKKTGRKLKFSELSDIFGEEFRAGKSDTGKIVEKRSKRLRKGTTGKEVQFFRRSSKKSKRTKSASIFKL